MKIKDTNSFSNFIASIKSGNYKSYRLAGLLLYTLLIFFTGNYVQSMGFFRQKLMTLIKQNTRLIPKVVGGILSNPEHFVIDIKHKDFQKLAYQREMALSTGILIKSDEDYVPARIRYEDKNIKVKIRLKGDWTDHLEGDKWSFRIKVKGENTIFGMKQFSIQHPKTRNYIYEWIFHQALKREGLIGLRYKFITVTLNGKDLGVYALEEHFEKRLIEHNQLREGPIVRFNEDLLWKERNQQQSPFPYAARNGAGAYLSSPIDGFHTNQWLSTYTDSLQYIDAIHLLESFRRGILKTSDVFDIQKLSKFFALTDLMGAQHATLWHNVRFYYNPITSRLEIIGFDANDAESGYPIKSLFATKRAVYLGENSSKFYENFYAMILNDKIFFQEYIKTLERISQPSYIDELFAGIEEELEQNLNILYSEFKSYEFSKKVFYRNQNYIKTVLNPVKGFHAYYNNINNNWLELYLGNIQSLPIEVLNVSFNDSSTFLPSERIMIPAKIHSKPIDYKIVRFRLPKNFAWSDTLLQDLKVNYKILGSSYIRYESIYPYTYLNKSIIQDYLNKQKPNVEQFNFLTLDESRKQIFIEHGNWNLNQSLIIPDKYSVICGAGTQLNLSNSAKVISFSPLNFLGTQEEPIVIQSADSTGQGIVVMNANQKSILRYVIFDNLSNPSQKGWELTGAVTFYESPVELSYCKFIGNRSEDGLNIIRSQFTIDNTLFKHTFSDAFDGDFVDGKITNSSFWDCGNDGVDVSGSVIDLQNVIINGAGDKGLSAGENTQMNAHEIEIKNAEIAVASKDMSDITIQHINISGCEIGFTAFQKKPEFGAASMKVEGLELRGVKIPYLVEAASRVIVDGVVIKSDRKNVKEILYGVEYGKSSK